MNQYRKQVLPNLSNSQFAYRAGVGTTDAIIYTIEHWTKMLDDRSIKAVEGLFKDLSEAFDSLQPAQLLKSLVEMSVTSDILKLSMDFMTNRQQSEDQGCLVTIPTNNSRRASRHISRPYVLAGIH